MKFQCMLLIFATTLTISFAEKINRSEIVPRTKEEALYDERHWSKKVEISKDIMLKADMEITRRGNGWLKIANLDLHVGRSGYDSLIYKDELLDVDFVDINGDGFKDIIISGLMLYPHEQLDIILYREAVVFIYLFEPKNKKFNLAYINSSCRLEEANDDKRELYGEESVIRKYVEAGHRISEELNRKNPDGTAKECVRLDNDCLKYIGVSKANVGTINLGNGIKQDIYMERGECGRNTWFRIANLKLNIYGDYFNVKTSSGNILDVDFIDINNDGYKDIIISGMVSYTKWGYSDIVLPSEYAVFIYTFEPDKKEFRCTYRNAPFKLEDLDSNNMIGNLRDVRTAIEKMEKSLEKKRRELTLP